MKSGNVALTTAARNAGNSAAGGAAAMESVLKDAGLLTEEAAGRARLAAQESRERFDSVVSRLGLVSERAMADAFGRAFGVPVIGPAEFPAEPINPDNLSVPFLKDSRVIPVSTEGDTITVAVADPFDDFVKQALGFVFGKGVRLVVASAGDIEAAVDRLYGKSDLALADDTLEDSFDEDDVERLKDQVSDAPVIRAVNRIIARAVDMGASDIHLEPAEDRLVIRYRIDGMLQEREPLVAAMRAPLVSRIKVMAGLNIAERRLPQDGRLKVAVRGHDIDLRVATTPAIHGESVVMRILDRSNLALDLNSLGFDEVLAGQLRAAIGQPHGIVLVTGPTGSGKTTTLYAALAELNVASRKLLTVEDPIEYRLPGIVQTQVNPQIGFTFGAALRSFLRLDPDVMMVGEIRDTETAQIAVQAALTGHMILSTLHTNSAAGAVTRLLDMDIEPFLLSSVLTGVLAQRLVRRLCQHCKEPFSPSADLLADLGVPARQAAQFYRAKGCVACGDSGYSGRVALLEFLRIDDAVARLILRRADARDIAEAGLAAGMRTLRADGLAKAAAGLTTVEEAVRVAIEA